MCSLLLHIFLATWPRKSNIRLDEIATWVNTNREEEHGLPYETNRSAADLQQICFTKNRLATDHFIVCKVCFQSVADALPSSSAKMFSCRRETDEKQICT